MIRVLFFVFTAGMVSARSLEPYHVPLGSSVWGYFTPPVLKRPEQLQTPLEAMVDLTNNLGVAILQDHSHSRGNFAFSPYGVASVLVVLYEGARCESANQIHQAVGFPSNKDVLRTGFRDIHRHLRSYFSHEGFLSGITLNKNGSDLKPEYKKILKYYGYDIDLNVPLHDETIVDGDAKPSTQGTQPTKPADTPVPQATEAIKPSMTTEAINEGMNLENETDDLGVKKPEGSTEKQSTERENELSTTTSLTTVKETLPAAEKESTEEGNEQSTTTLVTTTVKETAPTTQKINAGDDSESDASTALNEMLITTESVSEDQTMTVTSEPESNTEEPTWAETKKSGKKTKEMNESAAMLPEDSIRPEILEADDNKENKFQKNLEFEEHDIRCKKEARIRAKSTGTLCEEDRKEKPKEPEAEAPEGITESGATKLDNGMLIPQPSEEGTNLDNVATDSGFFRSAMQGIHSNKRLEEISLEEASGHKFLRAMDETTMRMGRIRKMLDSKFITWENVPQKKSKKTRGGRHKRTIADYLKWPLNPDLSLQLQNGMYDTHVSRNAEMYKSLPRRMFLVDGAMDTPVPVMTYANVFPYGYIPKLHAKALEFPLDDIRYKLLIVLPIERRGLRQLIYDLASLSVRDILTCLRPTRVEAIIPTFMVEGFVILTSSLQKLGIWDVFDPRKANLSGMSLDPELYVRNIEQSVTVVIRNYVEILDIQTRTMAARYLEYKFEATHPFVYFVLDTATNIALMAGQMLDPLNSRIY